MASDFVETVILTRKTYDQMNKYREMINKLEVLIYDEFDKVKELQKSSGNSTNNFGISAYLYIEDIAKIINFEDEYQAFIRQCEVIRKNNEVKDIAEGGEEE